MSHTMLWPPVGAATSVVQHAQNGALARVPFHGPGKDLALRAGYVPFLQCCLFSTSAELSGVQSGLTPAAMQEICAGVQPCI